MDNREVGHNDLKRLQMTLESLAADLDAIERRPHLLLRLTAETTEGGSRGIEGFVDHFAIVVERARSDPNCRERSTSGGPFVCASRSAFVPRENRFRRFRDHALPVLQSSG